MKELLPVLCLLSLLLGSCGGGPKSLEQDDSSQVHPSFIISNRSTVPGGVRVVYLYRLGHPALLAGSTRDREGNLVVDSEAQKRIRVEQKRFISKLKKISSDIQVIYTYQFVINGVSIATPIKYVSEIAKIRGITESAEQTIFGRPQALSFSRPLGETEEGLGETTTGYLGIDRVWEKYGFKGKGVKIGILDTGVDYTHSMLGGPGTKEAYRQSQGNDGNEYFPNDKVVGGIDLVGSIYRPGTSSSRYSIPQPDDNPMDEAGHGTHVAATSAGIGDGVKTFSGAAPEADIYAIKVFSKQGGTGDSVIIAGLEYAVDPNRDGDPKDHLDILNLSLGQSGGTGKTLYAEAIKNLLRAKIVVVTAAGNDGNVPYSVSSPSTVDEAVSVGSYRDAMPHNWRLPGVEFKIPGEASIVVVRAEAQFSKPIDKSDQVTGKLVYAGLADGPFAEELKEKIKGNIALIDRGKVSFEEKFRRAQRAGAAGVVIANNEPSGLILMSGNQRVNIPGISITLAIGDILKESLSRDEEIEVDLRTEKTVDKRELIDTLSAFSSSGPRSLDGAIKPEILAPGSGIISARAGSGTETVAMSGTSMSAPLVAGIFALLKTKFTDASGEDLKALLMNRGKSLADSDGKVYPISRQGVGKVQALHSIEASFLALPGAFSLGHQNLVKRKSVRKKLRLKNLTERTQYLRITGETSSVQFTIEKIPNIMLRAGETKDVDIIFMLQREDTNKPLSDIKEDYITEFEGFIKIFNSRTKEEARVPVYLFGRILSNIETDPLLLHASYMEEAEDALAQLSMANKGVHWGVALPFNLLGRDLRKSSDPLIYNRIYTRDCDVESAGYRFVTKDGEKYFQIGVKLHTPILHWNRCEISAQIDTDGDKKPEQELVGIFWENLSGLENLVSAPGHYSLLLDSDRIREERRRAEVAARVGLRVRPDYSRAVLEFHEMVVYKHSTVAVIQTSLKNLKFKNDGQLSVKLGTLNYHHYAIEADDFLSPEEDKDSDHWFDINGNYKEHGFYDLPEKIKIRGGQKKTINVTKGAGDNDLIVYMPMNRPKGVESTRKDVQSFIPDMKMKY